ncbi:MAG: hypothetical protein Kow00105_00660 [Phycisphaeraceae bacterium]
MLHVIACVTLAVAMVCAGPTAEAQTIQGDLNNDGFVGALDAQIILTHWGEIVTPGDLSKGDLSFDGTVGIVDLTFLLFNWGQGTIPTPGGKASVGMNLAEVKFWSREWAFVDAIHSARPWVSTNPNGQPFDTGQPVNTDAKGWPILQPGQAVHTLLLTDKPGAYPTGTYVVTWEGPGTLEFGFDATNVQTVGPNRMTFDVNIATKNGILLRVKDGDARNIHVWMPGFENAQSPFHPLFIQKLQPFGVIRFMDWQRTNGSTLVSWSQRTTPDCFNQAGDNGVALEFMIELCNELGADAWFCMPHMADDDFVTQFATMVRDNLDPSLDVYVEWSNEVWNVQFPQGRWVDQNSAGGYFSADFFRKWAQEASNDFAIWKSVFAGGTNPRPEKVIRVAAGQQANVWVTRRLTEEILNLGQEFDAIACGAYFDQRKSKFDASTTVQDIIDNAVNDTIPNIYAGYYQDHGDLAQELTNTLGRTIPLLAYEGGQHYTVHGNAALPYYQAFKDVQEYQNTDPNVPDMYDAYLANMQAFDQAGGSLFMAFNYVRKQDQFGSWGHLRFQDQSEADAPKYRALLDFNSGQP